jgi:transposase
LHSDLNAARNIATLAKGVSGRLSVNEPIVTRNEAYGCPRDILQRSVVASPAFLMRGS